RWTLRYAARTPSASTTTTTFAARPGDVGTAVPATTVRPPSAAARVIARTNGPSSGSARSAPTPRGSNAAAYSGRTTSRAPSSAARRTASVASSRFAAGSRPHARPATWTRTDGEPTAALLARAVGRFLRRRSPGRGVGVGVVHHGTPLGHVRLLCRLGPVPDPTERARHRQDEADDDERDGEGHHEAQHARRAGGPGGL